MPTTQKLIGPVRIEPRRYLHEAIVRLGVAAKFPWDMLRYESAWFGSEQDTAKALAWREDRDVRIECHAMGKTPPWEPERWKSFGITLILPKEKP